MSTSTLTTSPTTQAPLVTAKTARTSVKIPRPQLDPITTIALRDSHFIRICDYPRTAPLPSSSNKPTPSLTASSSLKRRSLSRRQSSISYLPADSPRLWTPRTPKMGADTLKRTASLSGADENKKETAVAGSIQQRRAHEPAVLTLAEKHADLLQLIAQKESKCLDLRSQLAIHESELLGLKHKWARIIHREFGRNIPSAPPSTLTPLPSANTSGAAVFNDLVGGVRALAAATVSPTPSSPKLTARASPSAKRTVHQTASSPVSPTTTTTSASTPSTRLSQSSMSSMAEERADKGERSEELIVQDAGATPTFSTNSAFVAQQSSSMLSEQAASPLTKTLRRRSRDSKVPLADALKPLTGASTNKRSIKRASMGAVPPTSIPGINSLTVMGLGRANLGEAAQGWMDSVGSKLAGLQKGQTFSKSQKRASVLFSDVSQSIFSALVPASPALSTPTSAPPDPPTQSLIDEDDVMGSTILGRVILPDAVAPSKIPPTSKDEDEEDWNW
ncbi:hypothetical protein B0F90DRAFT_1701504 [Multifurca ochricompacta]|uniref:Uncharacterized protein n=1 Tax=Multifurca ochricompacta TaxID=376703 RepID=A0AAD4M8A0_9AGAM|nr:hypothetical protein B0F90DRAFT_1701504 [Multifurca ochricompacta]